MKTRRLLGVLMTAALVLLFFAGCHTENSEQTETTDPAQTSQRSDIYRFEDYENSEVFNIKKVDLSENYARRCVSYNFDYLSDGLKIEGYLSIPLSFIETQKPGKCILFNRGGNEHLGELEDETTAIVCSVFDRIVIASQYRGGGSSQGKDEYGGDDLHDVIKLIDLCENYFSFEDMDDFCAVGISRGGVMTYPAARQDKRIRRVICISAESDLIDAYETRDDMKLVLLNAIGCSPEEDPAEYEKRSAMYWADEIKVPVLLIHSRYDELVSYRQSEELYEKLKDSTDCTMISYEDDKHCVIHPEDYQTIRDWLNQK